MKKINIIKCALIALCGLSATSISAETWLDYKAESYASGSGTESDPYIIKTAEQLALLSDKVNAGESYDGKFFKIGADIDLSAHSWVPIGNNNSINDIFLGTLKDDGTHVIKGLKIPENTYSFYGLFGVLKGKVEGIHLSGVSITNVTKSGASVGAICGMSESDIKNCVVEDAEIVCTSSTADIGGIVGGAINCYITGCVAKVKMTGNVINCGGIAGQYWGTTLNDKVVAMEDCHAMVNINVTTNDDSTHPHSGGLIGLCNLKANETIAYCSTSGEITTNLEKENIYAHAGGLIGYTGCANLENCSSAVTITGGSHIGGLVGSTFETQSYDVPLTITSCFSSGKIEADSNTKAAGGLIGNLYNGAAIDKNWKCDIYLTNNVFAGTFQLPNNQNEDFIENFKVGSLIGKCNETLLDSLKKANAFNGLVYDLNMCNQSPCGSGIIEEGVETKLTKELASQEAGEQVGYEYCYMMPRDIVTKFSSEHNEQKMATSDNYTLSSIPFYVSEGKRKTSFAAYYVTTPFSLAPLQSNKTNKELASFTLPNSISFVDYDENDRTRVMPLDPGEADVIITLSGTTLTRKVHLDIKYGEVWNENESTDIFVGDGSKDSPYIIQNVSQLKAAAGDENKNRADAYFQLANDIFINTQLIQKDESVKNDANVWTPVKWVANLDGNGKTIYGMYVTDYVSEKIIRTYMDRTYEIERKGSGLFSILEGSVHDMAIVDSYIHSDEFGGLFCGLMSGNGSLKRCMGHGIVDINGYGAGLVGTSVDIDVEKSYASSSSNIFTKRVGLIEDCFGCVHVEFGLFNYIATGNAQIQKTGSGRGLSGVIEHARRCISIGKVENFTTRQGIASLPDNVDWRDAEMATWYFDNQQMRTEIQSSEGKGLHVTSELITGKLLGDEWGAWKEEKGRYPMLKQFANTPYGDILSMPVHFADGDRAGNVTKVFEFPTEEVTWGTVNGDKYIDMINECGAASPMSTTVDPVSEYIYAQSNKETKSECTKALRVMAINTNITSPVGIEFKDPKCEAAWLEVFNSGKEESEKKSIVTLRNATEAQTIPEGKKFNVQAKAKGVEYFPEMRFFTGIKTLSNGILSGLDKLSEVQLPKALTTISENAFDGCSSLKEITIPSHTKEIAAGAFDNCLLKTIEVAPHNEYYEVRSNALFTQGTDNLVVYPAGRGESEVTISGAISEIENHAFYKIPQLNAIYFDNPKPSGSAPYLNDESIVHYDSDNSAMMDIYVNDGTFDVSYDEATAGNYDGVLMKEYLQQDLWKTYKNRSKLHRYFPLTITNVKWGTLYIGFSTKLPSALKAYRVNKTSDYELDENTTEVTLKRMNNLLHYQTPVVIYGEPGTYRLMPYEGTVEASNKSENWLQGTAIGANGRGGYEYGMKVYQSDANKGSILTLGLNSQGTLGFYYYKNPNNYIPPFKCYLTYNGNMTGSGTSSSNAKLSVIIEDDLDPISTMINKVSNGDLHNTTVYDIQGRKIQFDPNSPVSNQLPKGIYIINGRKVIVN